MKTTCTLCPHHCALEEGQAGRCRARGNSSGRVVCLHYGLLSGIALDPIEKKPLRRFFPGSSILSAGSYGCNLHCPFCQNWEISMSAPSVSKGRLISPEALVQKALELVQRGNIGLAYTYNEPLVCYEYVRDCAELAHRHSLKNVLVTNGMFCREPLSRMLPLIDAMNIDLKSFSQSFYDKAGGYLETVKESIALAAGRTHVEVTTLIIPGENDSTEEMERLAAWLSSVSPNIPLHISRFFPHYRMMDTPPTPADTVYRLVETARNYLSYVYAGNC